MSHSYISNYSHLVFSTKNREAFLTPVIRERLWRVMGGIMKNNGIDAITIGGYEDHCHALLSLPSTIPVAIAVKKLKGIRPNGFLKNIRNCKDSSGRKAMQRSASAHRN